ncbi:MAG: hypothetical protein ACRDH6_06190, partial [Actinomycetota bacterium]
DPQEQAMFQSPYVHDPVLVYERPAPKVPAGGVPTVVSVVLFREGSTPPAGDPDTYVARVVQEHYGTVPQIRGWQLVGRLDRPTLETIEGLYVGHKNAGAIPDYGTPTQSFEATGPDGTHTATLVFWHESAQAPAPIEVATPAQTGPAAAPSQDYVTRCLTPAFQEVEEPRSWRDPEFSAVLDRMRQMERESRVTEAQGVIDRFPDFDLGYLWSGQALLAMGHLDRAREVLRRGIERSKSKYGFCEKLGEVEWRSGNLAEAVYWWAQGIHCQETLPNRGGDVGSYLYLHYVAEGMDLGDLAAALARHVDAIRAGQIRLEPTTAAELKALAASQGTSEILEVLALLRERYFESSPTVAPQSLAPPSSVSPVQPVAQPQPTPFAMPQPVAVPTARGPLIPRWALILGIVGISLIGGGIALALTVFGGDDSGVTASGPPSAAEISSCLTEEGFAVERTPGGVPNAEALTFVTPEATVVLLAILPTAQAADEAHALAFAQLPVGSGRTDVLGNVVIAYFPPPTADLRQTVESCVPQT